MSRSYPGQLSFMMDTPPPPPSPPTYRIFRDRHGIPQFEPKRGTQALKDALIYSFPTLETELQLMQAALRKFFDSEKGSTFVFELPERDLQTSLIKKPDVPITLLQSSKASLRSWKVSRASRTPSRPSSRASSRGPSRASSRCETPISFTETGGTMTTWMLSNGQELEKRKRQPYDPVKRRKVAENRGNACEKHRASKTACDPEECPQNKLYGKTQGRPRRESEASSAYETPQPITPFTDQHPFAIATQSIHQELDMFFDAVEMDDTQMKTGALGFDQSMLSTMWPTTQTNEMPWDASINMDLNPGMISDSLQPISIPNQPINQGSTLNALTPPFMASDLHVVPEEAHHEDIQIPNTFQILDETNPNPNSEDPFMGWAQKRASTLFDEYGWVLSHVEAL